MKFLFSKLTMILSTRFYIYLHTNLKIKHFKIISNKTVKSYFKKMNKNKRAKLFRIKNPEKIYNHLLCNTLVN